MPKRFAAPLPLLIGVLLLALLLRVWGLTWGLPSAEHYFSYHPDESIVLGASSIPAMNVFAGHLLPGFYRYGSLQLYLVCFANTLAALAGVIDIAPKDLSVWYPQWAKMYLTGRILTVGMGVGTVLAVYSIGRRLWGCRAGLISALILAILPLHVQHSHFLTVDVPAAFWGTLSLLWAVRWAMGESKPWKAALWAGAFAGLAAATKYNMALAVLPLCAACWVRLPRPKFGEQARPVGARFMAPWAASFSEYASRTEGADRTEEGAMNRAPTGDWGRGAFLALGLAAFVLAFLGACPGAILENAVFVHDVRAEAVHVQNSDDPTFRDTGNGFFYQIAHNLDAGLGRPLLVLTLAAVGYALYRRERGDGLLAMFALPYYVLISLAAVRYARYTIPLLPILALWTGRLLAEVSRRPRPAVRYGGLAVGGLVLTSTLWAAVTLIRPMAGVDPRDAAEVILNKTSGRIGFAAMPWFGTPPVSPYFSAPHPGAWARMLTPELRQRIVYAGKDWDRELLETQKPEIVAVSEYDYLDALRLKDPAAMAYFQVLNREYTTGDDQTPGTERIGGLPTRGLPHDMLYTNPIILLYHRK